MINNEILKIAQLQLPSVSIYKLIFVVQLCTRDSQWRQEYKTTIPTRYKTYLSIQCHVIITCLTIYVVITCCFTYNVLICDNGYTENVEMKFFFFQPYVQQI